MWRTGSPARYYQLSSLRFVGRSCVRTTALLAPKLGFLSCRRALTRQSSRGNRFVRVSQLQVTVLGYRWLIVNPAKNVPSHHACSVWTSNSPWFSNSWCWVLTQWIVKVWQFQTSHQTHGNTLSQLSPVSNWTRTGLLNQKLFPGGSEAFSCSKNASEGYYCGVIVVISKDEASSHHATLLLTVSHILLLPPTLAHLDGVTCEQMHPFEKTPFRKWLSTQTLEAC